MKTKSKELSVICLSQLTPNIKNNPHYYLVSIAVAVKRKIMVIDEMSYFMLAVRRLRAQKALFRGARTVIDNCREKI
ncbi:hypothetical protein LHV18_19055 [Providencia rettgeri]|uniref:hypothetical protein n=1 Tax=Providencia TaxID=586 RepID=UPI000D6FBC0E|nr:hypothetical protein [Providencia rettgeri]ELR5152542.1 hypothetical protein [Providencia rettgeri]MCB4842719.1 hypothetical protein [Providencia rettgeri]